MKCKSRILNIFNNKKVDRYPVFEQAVSGDIVSELLGYKSLGFMTDLHYYEASALINGENAYADFIGKFKEDYSRFINYLDPDAVVVPWFLWEKPEKQIDDLTFRYSGSYGWIIRKYDPYSKTFGIYESSWDYATEKELINYINSLSEHQSTISLPKQYFNILNWLIEKYGEEKCVFGASAFAIPLHPIWLTLLLENPDKVEIYMDYLYKNEMHLAKEQIKLNLHVINGGGDLATKKGIIYSPRIFRELILPKIKNIIKYYNSNNVFYIFRTDGNIWDISDDLFIEARSDGYGEIDIDAGMDFIKLNEKYPCLTLWGGLSCCSLLLNESDTIILNEVERLCNYFSDKQKWIAGSSNSLIPGTNISGYLKAIDKIKNFALL